jgi:hypothetical protein
MNEKFKKIADEEGAYTDVSGRWVNSNGFNKFAERLISECIEAVNAANMTNLIRTSYDSSVVEGAKELATKAITDKFTK